jgi:hypothetical protein
MQANANHLGTSRLQPLMQDGERAIGTPNVGATQAAVMSLWVPDPAGGEGIAVAMPERIECIDDRLLLVPGHPHFLKRVRAMMIGSTTGRVR